MTMSKRWTTLLCAVHCALCIATAQEVQRAVTFGAGVANTYDTYLSPLEYRGPHLAVGRESFRMTHWDNIATQGIFALTGMLTSNRADNADEWGGNISYRQTFFYTWQVSPRWLLMAGGGAGADLGFLYNIRNSANNPAQAYLDASVHAAAAASYTWRWLSLRAQAEAPLAGLMFSPHYGQSYYEIFEQGNTDHNIVFTHPVNSPTLRAMFAADIRIRRSTLRIGYEADMLQAKPNNLRRHTYLHTASIGYVRRFKLLKP